MSLILSTSRRSDNIPSGCGGANAALSMAKAPPPPSSQEPGEEDGMSILTKWLSPVTNLASKQLKEHPDVEATEAARMLVRSHVLVQAENVKSTSIIRKALERGRQVRVDAWYVAFTFSYLLM